MRTIGHALNVGRAQNFLMEVVSRHVKQDFLEVKIIQTVAAMNATATAIRALRNLINVLHVML